MAACQDPGNVLTLSVVSAWEIEIKRQLGKLTIASSLDHLIRSQQQVNNLRVLPVLLPHVYGVAALPPHHKDPFDRLLIAQTIVENLTMVTADRIIAQYPVSLIW